MNLDVKNIKYEILSPGNIFWKKTSGKTVLISKKGDVLNHDLINKLETAEHTLEIEDSVDLHVYHEMTEVYLRYSNEVLMRDKIRWRDNLVELLKNEFIEKSKSQFELSFLAMKIFSDLSKDETINYVERDSELFKRHLNIASAYAFCAFLIGYYDSLFLKKIFSTTLRNLMALGESVNVLSLKEKIEYLRQQDTFQEEDVRELEGIAGADIISKTVMFERYDGSGLRKINYREMNDLEIIMVALNRNYGFENDARKNIFNEIINGEFKCEKRTLNLLMNVLKKKEQENIIAA